MDGYSPRRTTMTAKKKGGKRQLSRREILSLTAGSVLGASCRQDGMSVSSGSRPNVVVFVADALRADHLGCYGYRRPTSPEIDKFSGNSNLFEQCHSAATWTTPATASLLTGTPLVVHRTLTTAWSQEGIEERRFHILPDSTRTTGECLEKAGYMGGFFQSNPNADKHRDFGRGCQHFYYLSDAPAPAQMDAVLEWLATEAEEPFYAYIHMMDPHEPYGIGVESYRAVTGETLEASIALLSGEEQRRLERYHLLNWNTYARDGQRLDPEELLTFSKGGITHLVNLYDTEIRGIDAQFGRLLTGLSDLGIVDRTAVVFTSDHGEAFGEDGQFYHGSYLHDAQTHIPLIVRLPGQEVGVAVPWTVGQCNIHPSLLTVAGVEIPHPCVDASLFSARGELLISEDLAALTTLDHHVSHGLHWDFSLAEGTRRFWSRDSFKSFEGYDFALGMRSALDDFERSVARDQLEALVGRYRKLALPLRQPDYGYRPQTDDEASDLKALGYL